MPSRSRILMHTTQIQRPVLPPPLPAGHGRLLRRGQLLQGPRPGLSGRGRAAARRDAATAPASAAFQHLFTIASPAWLAHGRGRGRERRRRRRWGDAAVGPRAAVAADDPVAVAGIGVIIVVIVVAVVVVVVVMVAAGVVAGKKRGGRGAGGAVVDSRAGGRVSWKKETERRDVQEQERACI